ncbi:hypothetical protein ABPG77_000944 [Micractinium sp. CCAP 211/92]
MIACFWCCARHPENFPSSALAKAREELVPEEVAIARLSGLPDKRSGCGEMESAEERKSRLHAMREAAVAARVDSTDAQAACASVEVPSAEPVGWNVEPVLKFRNYALAAEDRIQHEKVESAPLSAFEEVKVDAAAPLVEDAEEVLVNVAPKKANWDLRRNIADKLARLERRTQAAMIKLMQQEEQHRQSEEE